MISPGTVADGPRRIREIACDESGYEGEKLVGGETDVFAHAGVELSVEAAAGCITELRRRIRSPALEYKANHLLREKHRPVLEWLLGPSGPIRGHAQVHLVDKTYFLVAMFAEEFADPVPEGRATAMGRAFYRDGRRSVAPADWAAFLASANDLLRTRNRADGPASSGVFHRAVDGLSDGATSGVDDLLRLVGPRIEAVRTRRREMPAPLPLLDPLVPAIVRTVLHWSDDGAAAVSIVHDRQTALTDERLARITAAYGGADGRLAGLRFVDSRSDPRVQVADFLAGIARKVASYELGGRGDAELVALLRPYVNPLSIWSDERSWSRLGPAR